VLLYEICPAICFPPHETNSRVASCFCSRQAFPLRYICQHRRFICRQRTGNCAVCCFAATASRSFKYCRSLFGRQGDPSSMTSKSQSHHPSSKSQSQLKLPTFAVPASPQSPRKLRKFQSHQALSTSFSSLSQPRSQPPLPTTGPRAPTDDLPQNNAPTDSSIRPRPRRARSNSDAGPSNNSTPITTQKRPARKTGSSGFAVKRSSLESLLRDGPTTGKIVEGLQELRYLVLSTRVDADGDGMVSDCQIFLLSVGYALKCNANAAADTVFIPNIPVADSSGYSSHADR
jgi:hypothetical protein